MERLIAQVRRLSDNEEFDDDSSNSLGITTQEISEYINDAQDNIQAAISLAHPKIFIETTLFDLVANQELYDLPSDIFLDGRIVHVEAKFSERTADYTALKQRHIKTRLPDVKSEIPDGYIRIAKKLAIQPIPSRSWTNGIRLTYQRRLPNLGFRIGQVTATQSAGGDLTRIDLNASPTKAQDTDLPTLASNYITQYDELTIVNKKGVIQASAIPVSTYDADLGYITIEPGHTLGATESISVDDYVVGGDFNTTHSEAPDTCERYLIAYGAWKCLKSDSMVDSRDQENELAAMLQEIVNSFREIDEDQIELRIDTDWVI